MTTYLKLRSDIEEDVRLQLADPNDYSADPDASDSHWDRDTIIFWFNKGVKDIRRKRPESRYTCGHEEIVYSNFNDTRHTLDSDTILQEEYYNLIVNFICWKCLSQDNVDEYSSIKASQHEAKYYGGI